MGRKTGSALCFDRLHGLNDKRHRFSSFQVIIAGFAAVDLVGALLLMLPIAAQQRCVTPFHEALFTSGITTLL